MGSTVSTNRIYISNESNNNISVIDGNTNTVIATVTVSANPLGVDVNTETNRIYVSNATELSVINLLISAAVFEVTIIRHAPRESKSSNFSHLHLIGFI